MAGFLGWLRSDGGHARVAEAIESVRHHPSFRSEFLVGDGRCGAAVLCRPTDPPDVVTVAERELLVAILGVVLEFRAGRWHRFSAQELCDRYLAQGIDAVSGLDGFYQLLIWDGAGSRLHILDDRVGSLWVQHAHTEAGVAFAPEAKALFRLLPLVPRMDLAGAVSFLNVGYPIGTRTLFEGVRLLAPAHRLSIDMHSGALEQKQTWAQRFEPEKRLGLREAGDLLYDAILTCAEAPMGSGGENTWIAMTGGYDSRVLLHALNEAGQRPSLALTWGATENEPDSDPPVACALAGAVGLSHRFYQYEAGTVVEHAKEWAVLSELASDNPGCFAVGPGPLCRHGDVAPDAMFIGDAVTNDGALPRNEEDALTTFLGGSTGGLQRPLLNVLRPEIAEAAGSAFWGEMRGIAESCPSSRLEDVQDFLWTQVYDFRWLFSPGFYKEPMLTAWRPMLLGPAYDALARIPAQLRAYRRVYVDMVQRRLPRAMRLPHAGANSLVDWQYASRNDPSLRRFMEDATKWATLSATPIAELLDSRAAETMIGMFFAHNPRPMPRQTRGAGWIELRRRFATLPVIADAVSVGKRLRRKRVGSPTDYGTEGTRLVWRLAVLSSMHEAVVGGAFTGGVRSGRGMVEDNS